MKQVRNGFYVKPFNLYTVCKIICLLLAMEHSCVKTEFRNNKYFCVVEGSIELLCTYIRTYDGHEVNYNPNP